MESQEIEQYLRELGDELGRRKVKEPVQVLLIGGAYMLLMVQNRDFTEDIDIFPLNFTTSIEEPTRQTKTFQAAVKAIAKQHKIRKDWLNDTAASMLGGLGPDPEIKLWGIFNMLHVYIPSHPEYILALKLFAGREKDENDIQTLCRQLGVQTRQQAQILLNKYVYIRWQIEHRVAKTLSILFP